jgi:GNAT superfamily N-acetyltransferase
MVPGDAEAVARLGAELGYSFTKAQAAARITDFAADARHCLLVAERDGVVIGWIHAHDRRLLQSPREVEIDGVVVTAEAQRAGVGRRLVAEIEQWAREEGHDRVRVRSNVAREGAHEFYPALGFVSIKDSRVYVKRL